MEKDGFLEPILQSRWEVFSLAFRAIVRMRTMVKEKHNKLSDDISLGKNSVLQKSNRWRLLSLVQGAIVRMKTMSREKHYRKFPVLSNAQLEMMLHCCLFNNNYEFESEKLIQLWIAAKFLQSEPLEDDGQLFFDFLVEKNFIFLSRVDLLTRTRIYKVNLGELNTFFALMPRITNFQMRVEDGNMTTNKFADSWHISVQSGKIDQITFEILGKYTKLSTLIFLNGSLIKRVPSDMFLGLKLLTTLDLSCSCITELPSSIGDAKELCYFDLSRTPIKRLPQSIGYLHKLLTLRLKGCIHIFELPKRINELVNLRHLDFDILGQLSFMPRGIDSLVHLRTLPAFIVDDEESCNIKELKHMNNLSGKLCISGLEHVVDSQDAKEADLNNKEHLKHLELRWSDNIQFHENEEQCFRRVVECMKPSFGLEELQIICFPGLLLPSWISDPQYVNLVSITLFKCDNCHTLPSLGQLLKLTNLFIIEMNSVKIIDGNFCGVGAYHEAFPMLEMLAIDGMSSLEAWMGIIHGECPRLVKLSMKRCPRLKVVHSFPRVRSLKHWEVTHCPLLEFLPVEMLSSPLETIVIGACPVLERRYSKGGEDSSKIRHVLNVCIESEDTQSSDEDDAQDDFVGESSSMKEFHLSDKDIAQDDFVGDNSSLKEIHEAVEDDISISDVISTSTSFSLISSVPSTTTTTTTSEGIILESPGLKIFSSSSLKKVTTNFQYKLGEGGFGEVFKGCIDEHSYEATKPSKGMTIAVKKLKIESFFGRNELLNEVKHLGKFHHPHIVKLIGYCLESEKCFLVYEYMPRGSLDNHLFRKTSQLQSLPWLLRMKVALGVAKALAFLHSDQIKIIHRNVKSSNVLLDSNYNAKLSSFKLATNGPAGDESHVSTTVMGTYGYAAPEYIATGHLYLASDVYSFGVVLLEMLCGRRVSDANRPSQEQNLVDWSRPYLTNKRKVHRILDTRVEGQYKPENAFKVGTLATRCLSQDPMSRPTMEEVVKELELLLNSSTEKEKAVLVGLTVPFTGIFRKDTHKM